MSIQALPNAVFTGSGSTATGVVIGSSLGSSNIVLPQLLSFSAIGMEVVGSLQRIYTGAIGGCPIGIEFYCSAGSTCLDNIVSAQAIYGCSNAAIEVNGVGSTYVPQGNHVTTNFITGNERWVEFVGNSLNPMNCNIFEADAVEMSSLSAAIAIDNEAGGTISQDQFICHGFWGGFVSNASWGNGSFNQCDFEFGAVAAEMSGYNQCNISEPANNSGNKYNRSYGQQDGNLYIAQTSPGSRSSFGVRYPSGGTAGAVVSSNRMRICFPIGSSFAPGAVLDFYVYSPWALGNARLSLSMSGTLTGFGVISTVTDNSAVNANEVHIQLMNVSGSTIAAGNYYPGILVVGIP
jgi:hypothetical protein